MGLAASLGYSAALAAAALALAAVAAAAEAAEYTLRITQEGLVEGTAVAGVEAGLNEIPLPVDPVEATIEAWIDGVRVPPLYSNGTVFIAAEAPGKARIEFLVDVNVEGGVISFQVSRDGPVTLVVPPEAVLLSLPGEIIGYDIYDNGTLVLTFTGPGLVEFTLKEEAAVDGAPAETGAPMATGTPGTEAPQAGGAGGFLAVAVALAAVGAFAVLMARRRGSWGGGAEYSLDETDEEILRALEEAGGEVAQSDLQRATGLPKTTLWRRLRRLEEAGFVEVKREGKVNRVRLRRRPG